MKQRLLSVKELAHELGVHEDTIRRAYWKKTIPAERICRLLRFDLGKVRRAMERKADGGKGQRSATGGGSRRRAQRTRPRLGKTGASIARTPRRKK
jgi:excisionase family DNA binding protein